MLNSATVVLRDLRRLSRRRGTFVARSVIAGIAFSAFWLTYLAIDFGIVAGMTAGKAVVLVLGIVLTVVCAARGVAVTSDALSEERRDGTLALLFLTPLSCLDLLVGRLVSTSLSSVYCVCGLMPIVAMAMLLGGVTIGEFVRVSFVILNTLFLSLMCGLFVSSGARDARRGLSGALFLLGVLLVGPFVVVLVESVVSPGMGLPGIWRIMMISPLYTLAYSGGLKSWGYDGVLFYSSLGVGQVVGWALFLASAAFLRRSFRRDASSDGLGSAKNKASKGKRRAVRWSTRAHWLGRFPFAWLFGKDRAKRPRIEGYLVALFFVGGLGHYYVPDYFEFQLILLLLGAVFLELWFVIEVVTRYRDERGMGSFELLLTSPLGTKGILDGTNEGLRRLFGRALMGLWIVSLVIYLWIDLPKSRAALENFRLCYWAAVIGVCLNFWALKWVGMWSAITSRGSNRAYLLPIFWILVFPWLLWLVTGVLVSVYRDLSGTGEKLTSVETLRLWMYCSYPVVLVLGWRARVFFVSRFQLLTCHGFDRRSAEAEWMERANLGSTSRARVLRYLPWPKSLGRQILASLCLLAFALIIYSQIRRVYHERLFRREIASFRVEQQPMPDSWFGGRRHYGEVPAPLFDIAVNVVAPRNAGIADLSPLDPVLSEDPKWAKEVIRSDRLQVLETVRSRNANELKQLLNLDDSVFSSDPGETKSFPSWNHARGIVGIFDVLGCEIYYQALVGDAEKVSAALLVATQLKLFLAKHDDDYLGSLGMVMARMDSWLRLALSKEALGVRELDLMDAYLQQIESELVLPNVIESRFQLLEAYVDFKPSWRDGQRSANVIFIVSAYRLAQISGVHVKGLRELLPWADSLFEALDAFEAGNASPYRTFTRDQRVAILARQHRSAFSLIQATKNGALVDCDRFIDLRAQLRLMRCGISIERFRLRQGRLPHSLTAVRDGEDASVWIDPYSGKTFEYELSDTSYRLQSSPAWTFAYGRKPESKRTRLWEIPVDAAVFAE